MWRANHILLCLYCVGSADALRLPARASAIRLSAAATSPATMPLLDAISQAGVVGVEASDEQQAKVEQLASSLSGTGDDKAQSRIPLSGTYELLYSMSKGGSSGKVGPLTGSVTQIIVDEKNFINQVALFGGAVTVQLHAQREILDDNRIRVSFVETVFILFGNEVKRSPAKGTGVWEQLYVEKSPDGSARLRVMRTPSLFVLRQKVA